MLGLWPGRRAPCSPGCRHCLATTLNNLMPSTCVAVYIYISDVIYEDVLCRFWCPFFLDAAAPHSAAACCLPYLRCTPQLAQPHRPVAGTALLLVDGRRHTDQQVA
jgi:hypothetical protein